MRDPRTRKGMVTAMAVAFRFKNADQNLGCQIGILGFGWMAGWLAGWLSGWLAGWLSAFETLTKT